MTIESSRQLLTAKDRIAARAEKAFKEAVSKDLPTQFNVMTFIYDSNPTQNASQGGKENQEYGFCRARSQAGHHDMLRDPVEIKDTKEREAVIQSHFQAYYQLGGSEKTPQNGDIWSAIQEGGVVRLISLVERKGELEFPLESNDGGEARSSYKKGKKRQNVIPPGEEITFTPSTESTPEDTVLFDLIAKHESQGNYNAANIIWYPSGQGGGSFKLDSSIPATYNGKDLTQLTFGEVKMAQRSYTLTRYPKTKPTNSLFAMGKYQVIPATMLQVIRELGFKDSDLYDETNQDLIIEFLIYGGKKRNQLSRYLLGSNSVTLDEAQIDLAREFSSIPTPNGSSYYGNEKSHHKSSVIREALQKAREANIKNGRTFDG